MSLTVCLRRDGGALSHCFRVCVRVWGIERRHPKWGRNNNPHPMVTKEKAEHFRFPNSP